ncbi:single-stranded DNA-binding protein [Kroppenstedtia guangzhouensis]|uniref:Single-stranded DNA-binding protein n=1 Tax=Kroppenstedtia guangzhouensis TaxID=1274356 RepID=A0ABQ1H2P3_9BACL|nr:ERF family protein [Kroppenstedtia guangzhouensis]GGA56725.1 single-stranded DNA-binding protein [Kroppenstedtia guangzhouensis]
MKTSENIVEICKALVGFHSEVGRITKDGTNPHLKNRYATIDQIIEEIRPILATHGLFILQLPTNTEAGEIQMTTRIYHTSGQWMESPVLTLKPQKQDAQGIGSAVTYARRYSLTSFLSLNTGDDDDGEAASNGGGNRKQSPARKKPQGQGGQQSTQQKKPTGLASEKQRRFIFAIAEDKGLDQDEIKALVKRLTGKESTKELTTKEARHLIETLQATEASELKEVVK